MRKGTLSLVLMLSGCLLKDPEAPADPADMATAPLPPDGATVEDGSSLFIDQATPEMPVASVYKLSTRSVTSSGNRQDYDLVQPDPPITGRMLPLVIALHEQAGGSSAGIRAMLKIEDQAPWPNMAVFVYPKIDYKARHADGAQNFADDRGIQADLIRQIISDLFIRGDNKVDPAQVLLTGYAAGGIMVNAVGCALNRPGNIRIKLVAPMTGHPYEELVTAKMVIMPDSTSLRLSDCNASPAVAIIWGKDDMDLYLPYAKAVEALHTYEDLQGCTIKNDSPSVGCNSHNDCTRALRFCAVAGLGHDVWSGAGAELWDYFKRLK